MRKMDKNIIHNIDCIEGLNMLPEKSVDICVTSPPYNLSINYKTYSDDKPRDVYLRWLNDVFSSIKRVLKDDGHFWLNMGYSNVDPWVGMDVAREANEHFVLQNNFTWVKSISINDVTTGHFKPINSDRFSNPTWEHLFHFTKSGKVKCNKLSVGVPYMHDSNLNKESRLRGRLVKKMGYLNQKDFYNKATQDEIDKLDVEVSEKMVGKETPNRRCKGNTWFIPYDTIQNRDKHRGSHPATYPVKLVDDCILFSDKGEGDLLIDPFMGSGTSAISAIKNKLDYIGYDISSDYIDFSNDRINDYKKNGGI